jgi:HPt (histidine-containing phosphotransfer) domain-containing protein
MLREAAARGDAGGMRKAAHALKSSSAMLGAMALSSRCADLERDSGAGHAVDGVARVAAIEGLYRDVTLAFEAAADRDPRAGPRPD